MFGKIKKTDIAYIISSLQKLDCWSLLQVYAVAAALEAYQNKVPQQTPKCQDRKETSCERKRD